MPQDTRLVVFRYDPNDSYLVLARPGAVTHLALEPGESVVAFALGDTVQWMVQDKGPNVFVKPVRPDVYTSGTLVTNRRTYQLGLRSSPEGGAWYQRVSWTYPALLALEGEGAAVAPAAARGTRDPDGTAIAGLRLDRLNFDYRVQGHAAFRPSQVLDDGRFTYLQMPAGLQEMPALFVAGSSGAGELVNYSVRGRYLVVHRLAERFLLKLGQDEVRVERALPAAGPAWHRAPSDPPGLHEASQ
jgi:type IV secretion system protein VirB9